MTIGRPLICNACGHMWEPPATLANYAASYVRGVAFFAAGAAVVIITCFLAWKAMGRAVGVDGDSEVVSVSAGGMVRALRRNYFLIGIVIAGLSLAGAGLWGMLRTLIVQMGWKGILYDPDESN